MFGALYEDCEPRERIKYGILNYANDRCGMKKCRDNGQSIIVLKSHLRARCTLANRNKWTSKETLSTFKYNYAVIRRLFDNNLKALYLASRGLEVDSSDLTSIIEVHVHGSIQFEKDV